MSLKAIFITASLGISSLAAVTPASAQPVRRDARVEHRIERREVRGDRRIERRADHRIERRDGRLERREHRIERRWR